VVHLEKVRLIVKFGVCRAIPVRIKGKLLINVVVGISLVLNSS